MKASMRGCSRESLRSSAFDELEQTTLHFMLPHVKEKL
ncbi:hypothetical protein ABH906_004230 [Pseudomonas frederiksbergensis]